MTELPELYRLDKRLMRRAFESAASKYDKNAILQHEVGRRMLERLDLVRLKPSLILDAGAGTGAPSKALVQRYPGATVIALDIARGMLLEARKRVSFLSKWFTHRQTFVCGDIESLPLLTGSVDMIFSNLSLQWCNDLDRALSEFCRVLRPGGLLMFSTFGPDTLKELRASWSKVDQYSHVNAFMDMHDIGDALVRARFANPVMDVERYTLTYPDLNKLMRDLKNIGAHNVMAGRPHGLTGKGRLRQLTAAYEKYRMDEILPASYEIVYGHAWTPETTAQQKTQDGVVKIPLAGLRGRSRHPASRDISSSLYVRRKAA
ncbi:MAG: malonyl-ACP O-methyltransferase BioC [Gammaproteobacteria bacterium]|nr:malonyl-ACP O-methyltransferase BioC [Gammaproteobacteria bacterium]